MRALPPGLSEADLARLAGGTREILTENLRQPRPGFLHRWLHGPRYTDIFLDFAPGGALDRVEITFAGCWLVLEQGTLRTGQTDEMDVQGLGAPASRFVQTDRESRADVLAAARILASNLPDRLLADLLLAALPHPG